VVSDKQYRRVLNVPADASPEAIRQAYLDLARVWHPDRFHSDERLRKIAGEHLREVNVAYAALKNHRPPQSQRPRPEQASAGPLFTSSQGSATGAEDPSPSRTDAGRPPSWSPSPTLRHNSSLTLVLRFISNNAARTAMVTVVLAVPYVAVSQLVSLIRVPNLNTNLISPLQPKILSPMRIIDPHSEVAAAAEALANWAHGDGIDLWKRVQPSVPDSPATAVRVPEDVGKPLAVAPRSRQRPVETTTHLAAPLNGADLIPTGRQLGVGELRLSNHTTLEAVFQLVSGRHTWRAVYVVPNGSVTLRSIPVGVYYLYVDLGRDLDVEHLRFLSERMTPAPQGPFQFLQITSETGIAGNHFDVVVNPQ
jgi:hypothetical protein